MKNLTSEQIIAEHYETIVKIQEERIQSLKDIIKDLKEQIANEAQQEISEEEVWSNFKAKTELYKEIREMYGHKVMICWGKWHVSECDDDYYTAQGEGKPKKADVMKHYKTGLTVKFDCYYYGVEYAHTAVAFFDGQWHFEELI